MIISRTPFRISFFGGGTDYPAWYREHGGATLGTTIDKYCYITCRYLPPFFEHRIRIVYSLIENCHAVSEIKHPAVREVLRYLNLTRGIEIHHDGDLPARSGIGSSSAFTVGILHACHALLGRMPSKQQLASESIYVEQQLLKETVGSQDQVLASYGGFNHIAFQPTGKITVRPITLPADRMEALNAHLMLFYTGLKRTASHVADSYVQGLSGDKQRKRYLHRIGEMVEEGLALLERGELSAFGRLLDEAWHAKRSLNARVTNAQVDEIYAEALSAGATGGKLVGAGGGGFLLLFVDPAMQAAVRERLNGLLGVPFKFEWRGSQIVFFDPEEDYSAEDRLRETQIVRPFAEIADEYV